MFLPFFKIEKPTLFHFQDSLRIKSVRLMKTRVNLKYPGKFSLQTKVQVLVLFLRRVNHSCGAIPAASLIFLCHTLHFLCEWKMQLFGPFIMESIRLGNSSVLYFCGCSRVIYILREEKVIFYHPHISIFFLIFLFCYNEQLFCGEAYSTLVRH